MSVLATRQQDMVSGLLADYSLGSLPGPVNLLVETHLQLSSGGRAWLDDLNAMRSDFEDGRAGPLCADVALLGGDASALDAAVPVPLCDHASAFAATLRAIDEGGASSGQTPSMGRPYGRAKDPTNNPKNASPLAIEAFLGMPLGEVAWKKVMPGFAEYKLPDMDGCEVSLLRIDGGKAMPVHTHHGSEITLVLQGGFADDHGHYGVGDIAYADSEVNHKPVADEGEVCICLAVVDAPLELTGPLGRLVNPFRR